MLTRRRFIAISAALLPALAPVPVGARSGTLHVETGIALGAQVTLRLDHPDAPRLAALAMAEIRRLEGIFSLYRDESALSVLNRDGRLEAPPFELLDCLSLAGAVHAASGGRFDPTVQPLWRAEARAMERGVPLTDEERAGIRALVGWSGVRLSPQAITLRPGMALTLNGIAQGFIADRVADLLAREGLTRALIDTGEMIALPEGEWPVELAHGGSLPLRNRALATSAPMGMTFGGEGGGSHILDPRSGRPLQPGWRSVSVSAPSAALADALSTAACLTKVKAEALALCQTFAATTLEAAIPT
ncbi:MAG: FAD:protein FMN transferase [Paracoccaceae bacterium]